MSANDYEAGGECRGVRPEDYFSEAELALLAGLIGILGEPVGVVEVQEVVVLVKRHHESRRGDAGRPPSS